MANVNVNDIPLWLREGLDEATTEGVVDRRSELRQIWMLPTPAKSLSSPDTEPGPVQIRNISRSGLCLISRVELHLGDELELSALAGTGEAVHVRVVYCKKLVQGYQVGCEFVATKVTPSPSVFNGLPPGFSLLG